MSSGEYRCEMVIRLFKPGDLESVLEIESASFPLWDRYSRSVFEYYYSAFPSLFFVVEVCGRVAGYVIGEVRGRTGHVVSIAVHPDYRGRGIGWALMERVEAALAEMGVRKVYLEVAVDNTPALNLYTKRGYRVVGLIEDYYSDGKPAYVMVKEIPASKSSRVA